MLESIDLARKVVEIADAKQASNIALLDMHEICSFADYFILCSADSDKQIGAIHEDIERALKPSGVVPQHCEGTAESGWVLLDFGDVVVHIFAPSQRDYYNLDELWSQASTVLRIQ